MNSMNVFHKNSAQPQQGSVYILSNPVHPLLKIGFTARTATERAKELYTTGVPDQFTVEYEACFADAPAAERQVHSILEKYRYSGNREFFRCDVETAKNTIDQLSEKYGRLEGFPPIPAPIQTHGDYHNDVVTEDRRHTSAANDANINRVVSFFFGIASAVTFLITFLWSPGILRSLGL